MRAGVYPINQNVSSCTMRYLLGWSAQTFGRIDTFYILFLIVNVMTVIILPILFVLPCELQSPSLHHAPRRILSRFRTWLDGARLLLLLICHIGACCSWNYDNIRQRRAGIALAFAVWNPSLQCPHNSKSLPSYCNLLTFHTLQSLGCPRRVSAIKRVHLGR